MKIIQNKLFTIFFVAFLFSFQNSSAQNSLDSIPFKDLIVKKIQLNKNEKSIRSHRASGYYVNTRKYLSFYDLDFNLVKKIEHKYKEEITMVAWGKCKKVKYVMENGKRRRQVNFGFFNDNFELVIPCNYKEIKHKTGNDYIVAFSFDDICSVFDLNGVELLKLKKGYRPTSKMREIFAFKFQDENYKVTTGVMDLKGNILLEFENEKPSIYLYNVQKEYVFAKGRNKNLTILNFDKDTILDVNCISLRYINEDLLLAQFYDRKRRFQLIDFKGNPHSESYLITPRVNSKYIYFPSLYNHPVKDKDENHRKSSVSMKEYSVFDIGKKKIVGSIYGNGFNLCVDDYISFFQDYKMGISDLIGTIIIPPILDEVVQIIEGKSIVRYNKEYYLINLN